MWRAKAYSKTPPETRNDVALHRKVWPMKNWAKHADHDHTMKELLSTGSPLKRSWEFYHELKCLFHKRAEKSTFAETIEQVNVEQASSMNKRAIITQSSCDEFWLEDKHTLIWDKCTDQLFIRLERCLYVSNGLSGRNKPIKWTFSTLNGQSWFLMKTSAKVHASLRRRSSRIPRQMNLPGTPMQCQRLSRPS
jgi:hypothetical protein